MRVGWKRCSGTKGFRSAGFQTDTQPQEAGAWALPTRKAIRLTGGDCSSGSWPTWPPDPFSSPLGDVTLGGISWSWLQRCFVETRRWLPFWVLANLATRSFQLTSRRCYLRWHQLVVAAEMFYGNQELGAAELLCPCGSEGPAAVSRRWNQEQWEAPTPKVLPWFQW